VLLRPCDTSKIRKEDTYMQRTVSVAIALAFATLVTASCASMKEPFAPKVSMEECVKAALAQKPGKVLEVEGETERGMPMFEIDIAGADGKRWELVCDGITGRIVKVGEERGDATAPAAAGAMITEAEARKAALAAKPGTVVEVELEVESDGRATFEYDIRAADGTLWEVEVDAATGKVLSVEREGLFSFGSR
jgi:uncharacterized membrane protein YkoI